MANVDFDDGALQKLGFISDISQVLNHLEPIEFSIELHILRSPTKDRCVTERKMDENRAVQQ